jgi:hypothetical protein
VLLPLITPSTFETFEDEEEDDDEGDDDDDEGKTADFFPKYWRIPKDTALREASDMNS